MAEHENPKKVQVKKVPDYTPQEETKMDFRTEEEEKKRKRNIVIGVVIGLLLVALSVWAVYSVQQGKIKDADVSTTVSTSRATTKPGSLEPSQDVTHHYVTRQLTVHRDENGVWRSYAGLEKTVGYTGVVGNDTGWWYIENDVVNFKYNGIGENDYGSWMIENGKVNLKYTGKYVYNGRMYTIREGKVQSSEKIVPTTATTTTTTTTTSTTASTTTTEHIHDWVPVYDGNAITEMRVNYCMCPECGLKFANRSLLEDHATGTGHKLSEDPADDVFRVDEPVEVIVGYANTSYRCSECGATTDKID